MTDTGRVPGEGLPENAGEGVPPRPAEGLGTEQPGVLAPDAYSYLDRSDTSAEDDDLLLMPGQQGAWGNEMPQAAPAPFGSEPGPHETAGRDSGSIDLSAVRTAAPAPQTPSRRPLHLGPPTPDSSTSLVRSLADRGPADAPMRPLGPPTSGPEYLDVPPPADDSSQGGAMPWSAVPQTPGVPSAGQEAQQAETVVPATSDPASPAHPVTESAPAPVPDPDAPASEPLPESGAPQAEDAEPGAQPPHIPPTAPDPSGTSPESTPDAAASGEAVPSGEGVPSAEAVSPGDDVLSAEAVPPGEGVASAEAVPGAEGVSSAEALSSGEDVSSAETTPSAAAVSAGEGVHSAEGMPSAEGVPSAEAVPPGDGVPSAEGVPSGEGVTSAEGVPSAEAVPLGEGVPSVEAVSSGEGVPSAESVTSAEGVPSGEVMPSTEGVPSAEAVPPGEGVSSAEAMPSGEAVPSAGGVPLGEGVPSAEAVPSGEGVPPGEVVSSAEDVPLGVGVSSVEAVPPGEGVPPAEAVPPAEGVPFAEDMPAAEAVSSAQAMPVHESGPLVDGTPAHGVPHLPDTEPEEPAADATPHAEAAAEEDAHVSDAPHLPVADPESGLPAAVEPPAQPETAVPVAATHAMTPQAAAWPHAAPAHDAPSPADAPQEQTEEATLGRFVPVEGVVPVTPHLAPTPPHALRLPPLPDQEPEAAQTAPAPGATVPAPRREGAQDAAPETVVVQQADDLDTRAAEQEESTAAVEEVTESTGPAAPGYDDAEREAVLRVMRERRDIRNGFRGDPIPHDVLLRVLEAAHTAPSVGHSQPWDFVVIRSAETRRTMHELAQRQRDAYAKSLPKGRAKQFKELKIEAILDTPVNIVVTADPTRGGRHTLGRHTQPQMAPYSSALAVENLWLAARAEGLGVGWVSFFDEREMVRALELPEHLEVVAYLCVGYVDEFPEEPELMQAGWSKRRPLSWVVHEETYGRRALPGEEPHDLLAETVASIRPLDAKALGEAWERQKRMTKPAGALGMLEIISAQLSGLSRQCPPPIPEPAAVAIFAGDHGVHAQGVTPWPQEVTGQMVANFLGGGAVCNAFASQVGAEVCVVDVGVASDLPATPGLLPRKVRPGTSDMTTGPALTREEVKQAIEVGIETARDLVAAGNKALLTGEMGIANTTASAALISVFTDTDPAEVTGRGTGINDETLARKTDVVRRAIELHQPDPADPIGVLAAFGGLEHAAMVGLLLGGASLRTPVILDGVSAGAAALVARAIAPEVLAACIAGHRSAEPGHVAALNKLGLRPLVDLDLRLGEGTGALLALPLVQSAARAMHEVATFDSAGVTEK
ncbi:nicotinate-nucleotide--dimethylbenzimidazole phosphoribosyltransferase [Streptomyces sp. NPDC048664]|uniref:nicotinate-nucleotide--dimethylbenzimidazole phosphoribosyltransferase n=1 Tax=Streptomyces sp. NPDC048664 TaxID=3154505 RepID=UPI00341703D1